MDDVQDALRALASVLVIQCGGVFVDIILSHFISDTVLVILLFGVVYIIVDSLQWMMVSATTTSEANKMKSNLMADKNQLSLLTLLFAVYFVYARIMAPRL